MTCRCANVRCAIPSHGATTCWRTAKNVCSHALLSSAAAALSMLWRLSVAVNLRPPYSMNWHRLSIRAWFSASKPQAARALCSVRGGVSESAREQLAAGDELDAMGRRHALYLPSWPSVRKWKCAGHSKRPVSDMLQTEIDNLRSALAWSVGSDVALGIRIISGTLLYSGTSMDVKTKASSGRSICSPELMRRQRRCRSACCAAPHIWLHTATSTGCSAARPPGSSGCPAVRAIRHSSVGRCMVRAPWHRPQQTSRTRCLAPWQRRKPFFRELEDQAGLAHVLNSIGEFARVRGEQSAPGAPTLPPWTSSNS